MSNIARFYVKGAERPEAIQTVYLTKARRPVLGDLRSQTVARSGDRPRRSVWQRVEIDHRPR